MSIMDVISDHANKNLKNVPETIMQMVNLKMLYLENNEIEELPNDFFEKLNKLAWLDLRRNKLTTIPSNVVEHKCLETILLQNNKFEVLPTELGVIPNLKVLQISGNPLVYPPKDILEQGILTVCSFLKTEYTRIQSEKSEEKLLSIVSPDSSSTVSKDEEIPIVESETTNVETANIETAIAETAIVPIENVPENVVSIATPAPSSVFKRTHKITRGCSKICLRSHSTWNNKKKNERVQEETLKDMWLKRLTDLLSDQEKILQQEKNLKALSKWRMKKKLETPKKVSFDEVAPPPYDIDPECDKIMSRKDLYEPVEPPVGKKFKKKKCDLKKVNIQELIDDVVNQMKYLQTQVDRQSYSPRTEQEIAGKEIESIIKLHRKIVDLQQKNYKF